MRLAEEDIRAIQVDGPRRRVYIKFTKEDRMKDVLQGTNGLLEFRHDNGEISQVRIEHAGMGTRKVRVAGLPPEVKEHSIKECLSNYGDIVSIRDELWAAAYRYKVYNGIRIVEIKLKRHLPSHLAIAGNDALISYEGQPQTCYRCNETGHQQIDCPRKKRLDPSSTERRTTWADIVSNTTSDTQPIMNMQQSTPMPDRKPENHNRTPCDDTLQHSHTFPQGTQSAGSSKDTNCHHPRLSTLNFAPPLMDRQESVEGRDLPSRGNTENDRPGTPPPHTEEPESMEDEQTGDMEASEPLTTDVEGKPPSLGRRQPLDNNSDADALMEETSMPAPLSNEIRPKKLKTERDEPTARIRNRSKTRIKNTYK